MARNKVCIYHISEIYLYEYYCQPGDYEIDPVDHVQELMEKAAAEEKRGGLMGALQAYEKAHALNPVSTQIYFHIIDCYYRLNNLEMVLSYTKEAYPFLATRAEMAAYYRWLGWYYLERYQPALSEALYRYSTFFAPSQTAESEITYLEAALDQKMPDYTIEELQQQLTKARIPTTASNVTMALIYRAGEEAQHKHNFQQALDCFRMVYDLTADAQIREKITTLESMAGTKRDP